jgi:exosome complex exonuclease RRP6
LPKVEETPFLHLVSTPTTILIFLPRRMLKINGSKSPIMDLHVNFKTFQDTVSSALVSVTRTATGISAEDLGFQRSLDPTFADTLDKQNARLLVLAEHLLANAASGSEVVGPKLHDADAVESSWRGVVDVVDSLLEKADTSLDEYTGVVKRLSPSYEQVRLCETFVFLYKTYNFQATTKQLPSKPPDEFRPKDLPKPQRLFENVPQNNETGAFKPLITSKPHAMIPLEESLSEVTDSNGKQLYVGLPLISSTNHKTAKLH